MSSIGEDQESSNAKPTLWRAVLFSYADWFKNFSLVLRSTAFWIVFVAILLAVADWLSWSVAVTVLADLKSRNPKLPDIRATVAIALYLFVMMVLLLASVDIAVNWQRHVILNENPHPFGGHLGRAYYWKYLSQLLLVLTASATPLIALFGLVALDGGFEAVSSLDDQDEFDLPALIAALLILFTVAFIFVRLSLVLPSAATSALPMTWKQSVTLTRGNSWRLIVGLSLCTIAPSYLIDLCLGWAGFVSNQMSPIEILITTESSDLFVKRSIKNQILAASGLMILPITVGFLASSYQQLVKQRSDSRDAG